MRRDPSMLIVDNTTGEPIYEEIPESTNKSCRLITEEPVYEQVF